MFKQHVNVIFASDDPFRICLDFKSCNEQSANKQTQQCCGWMSAVRLQASVINHLLEFFIGEAVQLDDELAVCWQNLCARVDYLYDVKLLPKSHLCAHFTTQILNIFHLKNIKVSSHRH